MVEGNIVYGRRKGGVEISGPSLKFIVESSRKRIKALNDKLGDRAINAALMAALMIAGYMWIKVFLPKRFDKSYAEGVLQYRASERYKAGKRSAAASGRPYKGADKVEPPQDTPFVLSGKSRALALAGAYPKASVMSKGSFLLTAVVPRGRITQTPQASRFSYVPAIEKKRIAEAVVSAFEKMIVPSIVSGDIGTSFQKQHIPRLLSQLDERKVK